MLAIASQILICLILAALLGLIIGYLIGRLSCGRDTHETHIVDKTDAHCGESAGAAAVSESGEKEGEAAALLETGVPPRFLPEPREGGKDNLTLIKGIGRVIEEKLNKLGIFHFDQIAEWTKKEIEWIDEHLAFPGRVEREKWVDQAKKLASGEKTEFAQRVEAGEVPSSKQSSEQKD